MKENAPFIVTENKTTKPSKYVETEQKMCDMSGKNFKTLSRNAK